MNMRVPILVLIAGLISLALAGCQSPNRDPRVMHMAVPPDFWLSFHVHGHADAQDIMEREMRFVLQPDRRLHMGKSDAGRLPPPWRTLSPRQIESLVELVNSRKLMAEPSSIIANIPAAERSEELVIYHVEIHGWGHTNRYTTTPQESPPTAELLQMLHAMSQGIEVASPTIAEEQP